LLVWTAAASFSAVPHSFTAGRSVVAQEMNDNFAAVDSALQNRATKSDLSPLTTKADTGTVGSLSRKFDELAKSKQNNLGYTPMNKAGDTATGVVASKVGGYFGQAGGVPVSTNVQLSAYAPKNFANMYLQGQGAGYVAKSASGEWSFGTRDDGLGKSTAGSWVINDVAEARVWGNKSGTNILTPLNVTGATTMNEELRVGGGTFRIYTHSGYGSIYGDTISTKDGSNYSVAWKRDGTEAVINARGNYMQVTATGNVISGNTKVIGTITTGAGTKIPDYVFEPGYKLAHLSEVEAFTKTHKHLPEVPSAKEIEKGGLDLAQMNLILLKKVEELTLHAIEQQKQIDALTKKVGGL